MRSKLRGQWSLMRSKYSTMAGPLDSRSVSQGPADVTASKPIAYHVDGEPFVGGTAIAARIHPGALRVRVRAG